MKSKKIDTTFDKMMENTTIDRLKLAGENIEQFKKEKEKWRYENTKSAEIILPKLFLGLSLEDTSFVDGFVINEDLSNSEGVPTGVDVILPFGREVYMFQIKTDANLSINKFKEDAIRVYEWISNNEPKEISEKMGISLSNAELIKINIKIFGYKLVYIASKAGVAKNIPSNVIVWTSRELKKSLRMKEMPWIRVEDFYVSMPIENQSNTSIIHKEGKAIDTHVTLKVILETFGNDLSKTGQIDLLFEKNVRGSQEGMSRRVKTVKDSISSTVVNDPLKFINFNNGITIIVEKLEIQNIPSDDYLFRNVTMKNPSIVNGQQTLRVIKKLVEDSSFDRKNLEKASILVRITEANQDEWNKIAEATNKMIPVGDMDLLASSNWANSFCHELLSSGIFIETKHKLPKEFNEHFEYVIDFEELFIIVIMVIKKNMNISNVKTQKIDDFNEGKLPKVAVFFNEPNKNLEQVKWICKFYKLAKEKNKKNTQKYNDSIIRILVAKVLIARNSWADELKNLSKLDRYTELLISDKKLLKKAEENKTNKTRWITDSELLGEFEEIVSEVIKDIIEKNTNE